MFTIVGFKNIISKKNNVSYTELHLLSEDRFIVGQRCDVVFVRSDAINSSFSLGDRVRLTYNRYGKVDAVDVI